MEFAQLTSKLLRSLPGCFAWLEDLPSISFPLSNEDTMGISFIGFTAFFFMSIFYVMYNSQVLLSTFPVCFQCQWWWTECTAVVLCKNGFQSSSKAKMMLRQSHKVTQIKWVKVSLFNVKFSFYVSQTVLPSNTKLEGVWGTKHKNI